MNPAIAIRVLHRCRVAPPPGSAPPTSLPLTFFDIPCFLFPPYELLFFFQLPIPTSHFTAVTLPKLKHSLSLTLLEYFPFSGRLIQSPESEIPEIVYSEGDSVAVTVAEADGDFDHFCGHHSKDAGVFHELVPKLKHSLSLTLLEYFPFSGRLIQSPESEIPEIVYSEGDSVAVTVAEADGDFDHFCGHHSKDAGVFHELVPRLSDSNEVPMMAVQIMVFG